MSEIPRMVLVASRDDTAHIPEEWRDYPVIIDSLVLPKTMYLIDDSDILEQLQRDRERLGFPKPHERRAR